MTSGRSDRSSRIIRGRDGIALGGEAGITLDKEDDCFDERPDSISEHNEPAEETENNSGVRRARGRGAIVRVGRGGRGNGHNHTDNENNHSGGEETDVGDALFLFAEVPAVRAELAEENPKQASDGRRFNFCILH